MKSELSTTASNDQTVRIVAASALLLGGLLLSVPQQSYAEDFTQRVYVTGGVGVTRLEPESPTPALSISDKSDAGAHLGLGYDLSRIFSVEAYVADLGEAEVEFLGVSAGSIDYQVYGISLLGYLFNSRSGSALIDSDTNGLFRREGLSVYGRAGIGHMLNDSNGVAYKRDYPTHAAFGLGLEYGFRNGVALRTELMGMDTDARYLNVGILKRFGGVPVAPVAPVEPEVVAKALPEPELPTPEPMAAPLVPPLVYFEVDHAELNVEDRQKLDDFATAMLENDMTIQIDGHTDWIAKEQYNMSLSVRRAETVFNYLASKGLPEERMTTMGYGETRPISNNNTANGRALNRRAELQIK
ncbi:OmpA family protein [Granulosicoccus antarcticus]|uniref:Outer membrane porin F n=1 Tax=Granulosicoccus antarcticus IMCC3135 TaxID=1192854 RepID=A0A2Z2NRM1_9GAMM|nr:OmpA family protein [Granulosicoccus antarcticus]ASJ71390.1 Outer membrane porin F [Granulosicoccus antarcticus IMCC3135]